MSDAVLRAKGLQKSYVMGHEALRVLRGVDLEAHRGEFLVITGASGSGKSTLLHLLGALDAPDRGTLLFDGQDVFAWPEGARRAFRNRHVGFVFQFYHLLPELNVLENVALPRMIESSWWQWRIRGRRYRRDAEQVVEQVGLRDRSRHRPNELSGGERQRVAIARALMNRPTLLLADEPTGNLDAKIGAEILRLLVELNTGGQTVIMVTHDAKVASCAHRRVQLSEGVIRADAAGGLVGHSPGSRTAEKVAP
jgi:lipoprotein-releasing system ATP-binding protein